MTASSTIGATSPAMPCPRRAPSTWSNASRISIVGGTMDACSRLSSLAWCSSCSARWSANSCSVLKRIVNHARS